MTPEEAARAAALEAVEELLAMAELREADEPHTILVLDPVMGSAYASGLYPSAYAAAGDCEKVRAEVGGDMGHDAIRVRVIPIYGAPRVEP